MKTLAIGVGLMPDVLALVGSDMSWLLSLSASSLSLFCEFATSYSLLSKENNVSLLLSTKFNFSFVSVNIEFNVLCHRGSFSGAKPLPLVALNTIKSIRNSNAKCNVVSSKICLPLEALSTTKSSKNRFKENKISFESELVCYYCPNSLTLARNTLVFNLKLIQIIKIWYSRNFYIF